MKEIKSPKINKKEGQKIFYKNVGKKWGDA